MRKKILFSASVFLWLFVMENFVLVLPSENGEVEPQEMLSRANILGLPLQALLLSHSFFIPTHFYSVSLSLFISSFSFLGTSGS